MSYIFGKYITEEGLVNIKNHQYKPGEYSPIDNLMNPFWIMISEWLPRWMAPNLVTLLGLIALVGSYLTMVYYDMSMTQPLPNWTYFAVAIGIYVFQTMDAIDGKQARRTGSSSPLGQLFDHGCDAISWTVTNLSIISFLGLGISFKSVMTIYASIGPFYIFNLIEYYTGVFLYTVGVIDGTTGQFLLMFFNFLPFFFGGEVYDIQLGDHLTFIPRSIIGAFTIRDGVMLVVVYIGAMFSLVLVYKVYQEIKDFKTRVFVTLQLIQHYGCYVLMYLFDDNVKFIHDHAAMAYMSVIFLYALITTKMIV